MYSEFLVEEKVTQNPPCPLNSACLLNYFSKIFHPAHLIQPARLILSDLRVPFANNTYLSTASTLLNKKVYVNCKYVL